jgi:hypothetical protein
LFYKLRTGCGTASNTGRRLVDTAADANPATALQLDFDQPIAANQCWSLDFIHDQLSSVPLSLTIVLGRPPLPDTDTILVRPAQDGVRSSKIGRYASGQIGESI